MTAQRKKTSSGFLSPRDRTAAVDAAIVALRRLPERLRGQVYAEAVASDMKRAFAKRLGKPTTGDKSWRRLIGKRSKGDPREDRLPADDHVELWVGKEVTYVSHPYHLTLSELREIVRICDENGLEMSIDASSW